MEMTKIDTLTGVTTLFEHCAAEFLTKGYFYAPEEYSYWSAKYDRDPIIPPMTVRKFVRRVAKENKRPFIRVWDYYARRLSKNKGYEHVKHGICVEIPKRKYTAPLVHCLASAGFSRTNEATLWTYTIDDPDFAKEYLSFFETREEFRKALKLPV